MDKFAVFGDPINHSISPRLHNMAIKEFGFDAFYGRIHLEDGSRLKELFLKLNLQGANITVPYKEIAYEICNRIDPLAEKIGAVNTIVKKDGEIYGYNTDAGGFLKSIKFLGEIKKALIIGAGGSAKAIAYGLKDKSSEVHIVNRSQKRAENFKDFAFYTWNDYKIYDYDIVINSTSAGLKDDELPLPKELLADTLKRSQFAYEIIYNKATPFLQISHELNIDCKNGADMLLFQAILAFNRFYFNDLDEQRIESAMRKALFL